MMSCLRLFIYLVVSYTFLLPAGAQVTEPVDLDDYTQVLYVSVKNGSDVTGNGTQVNPYQSIQRAITDASVAKETAVSAILVASGTYAESPQSWLVVLTPWIHLYGGFSPETWVRDISTNPTILDGGNKLQILFGASNTCVDGFIITRADSSSYGAVGYRRIDSVTLSNCVIKDNGTQPRGIFAEDVSLLVRNCSFSGNHGAPGAAIFATVSSLILDSCIFSDNNSIKISDNSSSFGGAIHLELSTAEITDCIITGNKSGSRGGGIDIYKSTANIAGCTITDNYSANSNGGGLWCGSSSMCVLTNCVIADNTCSENGGAIRSEYSVVTLLNCTIAGNTGGTKAGGISTKDSSLTILNSILWNHAEEIIYGTIAPVVSHSCIQGGYIGEGNIDVYPRFISYNNGDYRLLDGSPCIDSASVSIAPTMDIAGRARPGDDGKADMGAYESVDEYEGETPTEPVRYYVDVNATSVGTGLSWAEAFPAITDALWFASYNTEIWIASGTYQGSVRLDIGSKIYGGFAGTETHLTERDIILNKTIIDAVGSGSPALYGAQDSLIDGITLTGGQYSLGGGLYYYSINSATIENCTIRGNSASSDSLGGGGLYCTSASPYLKCCTFENNTAGYAGGAIYLANSSAMFESCFFQGNSAQAGGVMACENSSPTLVNCIMYGNSAFIAGAGLYCDSSIPNLIHCTIAGNNHGLYPATGITCRNSTIIFLNGILWNSGLEIQLESSTAKVNYSCVQGGWAGTGNINVYPAFVGASTGDWHLAEGSPCIDSGTFDLNITTDLSGNPRPGGDNKVDMGAYESADDLIPSIVYSPSRLYVDSLSGVGGDGLSWEQALPSIGGALWLTGGGTEIWLASGDYSESIWLEPGIAIYGGLAGAVENLPESRGTSTIDASFYAPYRPVTAAEGTVLDHLTITGALSSYEGALYFNQVESATVSNCVITGNTTEYCGGVLCAYSSPTLINSVINDNWTALGGGGLHCDQLSAPHLVGCTISGNHSEWDGGGVYCYLASPIIEQSTIAGNNCVSYGGGIICDFSSEPHLVNSFITGNSSRRGSAVSSASSQPVFTNCTIAGNIAEATCMLFQESSAVLTNCIYWSNTPAAVEIIGGTMTSPVAYYCNIEGGWPGEGGHNIAVDPLFVGNGDFHLQATSPCIGKGIGPELDSLVPLFDIDNDARSGKTCDMGADEYNGPTSVVDWFSY